MLVHVTMLPCLVTRTQCIHIIVSPIVFLLTLPIAPFSQVLSIYVVLRGIDNDQLTFPALSLS